MKSQLKKIASILLSAALIFSMCAVFSISASAAEASGATGVDLTVAGTSNYCVANVVKSGDTVTVTYNAPAALNVVDVQWGLNYDKAKLELVDAYSFSNNMLCNFNSTAYSAMGSVSNISTPVAIAEGDMMFTFEFTALAAGDTTVELTVIDLMNRVNLSDEIVVANGRVQGDLTFKVNAKSNFFAENSYIFQDVSSFEDANGDVYVTVEYKLLALNKYIINVDIDELTYDPAVLEWSEAYNTYGEGQNAVLDFFPFAAEEGKGAGVVQKTANGRLVGNYSTVTSPAYAYSESNEAVTVVAATFKVLDENAGETDVICNVDTLSLCDQSVAEPYMQYLPIDKKVVNAADKAKATYETAVYPGKKGDVIIIGDVDNDGVVTISDATAIQRWLAEFDDAVDMTNALTFTRADTNKDGKITIRDVTEIQRFIAEIIDSF